MAPKTPSIASFRRLGLDSAHRQLACVVEGFGELKAFDVLANSAPAL